MHRTTIALMLAAAFALGYFTRQPAGTYYDDSAYGGPNTYECDAHCTLNVPEPADAYSYDGQDYSSDYGEFPKSKP
jgi:hypothetical protein